jgi:hypothetical protein
MVTTHTSCSGGKSKFFPVSQLEDVLGSEDIAQRILDLDTRWR